MTRKEALAELIAKVEANADAADVCQTLGVMSRSEPWDFCSQSISAYRGSLDAPRRCMRRFCRGVRGLFRAHTGAMNLMPE